MHDKKILTKTYNRTHKLLWGVIFTLPFSLSSYFLHSPFLFYYFFHLILFLVPKLPLYEFYPLLTYLQLWHTRWKNPSLYISSKRNLLSYLLPLCSSSFHIFLYPLCEFFFPESHFSKHKTEKKNLIKKNQWQEFKEISTILFFFLLIFQNSIFRSNLSDLV